MCSVETPSSMVVTVAVIIATDELPTGEGAGVSVLIGSVANPGSSLSRKVGSEPAVNDGLGAATLGFTAALSLDSTVDSTLELGAKMALDGEAAVNIVGPVVLLEFSSELTSLSLVTGKDATDLETVVVTAGCRVPLLIRVAKAVVADSESCELV
jgi:hypothetical protein